METDLENQIRELIDRGAQPISFQEISQRNAPAARREARRRRTLITVAASGVARPAARQGLPSRLPLPAPR